MYMYSIGIHHGIEASLYTMYVFTEREVRDRGQASRFGNEVRKSPWLGRLVDFRNAEGNWRKGCISERLRSGSLAHSHARRRRRRRRRIHPLGAIAICLWSSLLPDPPGSFTRARSRWRSRVQSISAAPATMVSFSARMVSFSTDC